MESNKKGTSKNNTEFVPVDSEHFSIWHTLKNSSKDNIEKYILLHQVDLY